MTRFAPFPCQKARFWAILPNRLLPSHWCIEPPRLPLSVDEGQLAADDHNAEVFEEAVLGAVVDDALVDLARLELVWGEGTLNFSAVVNGIALRLFQHGTIVCGRVHVKAIAEDFVVVAVEGGLADVQAMAVPESRLGLPLFGAVVKGQLQDSGSIELWGYPVGW